ncbi:MAG: hypothetical protein SF069_15930 [Phycisphaerae bacterium]|nr:hypothetical protein [Phycisphaerae bacterium]
MRCHTSVLVFALASSSPLLAQSLNIAIGPPTISPSSSYGGAGRPGVWNAIQALHASSAFGIVDVDGNATSVRIRQIGGMISRSTNDPGTSGDDEKLMDHCMVTTNPTLETCIFIDFLEPGEYEAIVYAMMPAQPGVRAYVSSDEEPGFPRIIVGGAWPGQHQELITYSRHHCIVGPTGLLRLHSGIVPGDPAALGAAMNGFQIRKLPPLLIGDLNCDGVVSVGDIAGFVLALTDAPGYLAANPACNIDHADINNDGVVSVGDIAGFVALLTGG